MDIFQCAASGGVVRAASGATPVYELNALFSYGHENHDVLPEDRFRFVDCVLL